MTKNDLIRTILEECHSPARTGRTGAPDRALRSPAAGGGLSGTVPPRRLKRRRTLRNPQTGDAVRPTHTRRGR